MKIEFDLYNHRLVDTKYRSLKWLKYIPEITDIVKSTNAKQGRIDTSKDTSRYPLTYIAEQSLLRNSKYTSPLFKD